MRAVVTGANGFIGSHLVKYLLDEGWDVRCLVRRQSNLRWIEHLDVVLVYGDCRDRDSLYDAVRNRDVVFHLAGKIRAHDYDSFYAANYTGTRNLIEVCGEINRGLKRFVYVSSIAAAGPSAEPVLRNESAPCNPSNDYGKTKLLGEEAVRECAGSIPYVIIRPPNVYGPHEEELYSILRVVAKRLKPLFGNGKRQTTVCHVHDLVRSLVQAALSRKSPGNVYYVTDGNTYSYRETVDLIAELLGVSDFTIPLHHHTLLIIVLLMQFVGFFTGNESFLTVQRLKQLRHTYMLFDGCRAERDLGYRPGIGLREGLRTTIDWYRREGMLR